MTTAEKSRRVDAYLDTLRKGLAGLSWEDANEIVEEIRSHILEKTSAVEDLSPAGLEPVLAALGRPEDLAAQYMADDLLARAASSWSPLLLLRGLLRWASLSVAGVWVVLACVIGYFLGASFVLCAILKPIHPHTAGLWMFPGDGDTYSFSLRLGFDGVPQSGREVLGWWIVPLGLLIGGGLCFLTTQFALWCARQYRKSHESRRRR